jgi:nucleotide-binding universal stress UspA family protein
MNAPHQHEMIKPVIFHGLNGEHVTTLPSHFKHILVPTDLSNAAFVVARYATDLARSTKAKLTLLHVLQDATYLDRARDQSRPASLRDPQRKATRALQKLVHALALECNQDGSCLRYGDVVTQILLGARELAVDLIAISTRQPVNVAGLKEGSYAERIVRYSEWPVLVLYRQEQPVLPWSVL